MKFKKLFLCVLAALVVSGSMGVSAYAAEVTDATTNETTNETTTVIDENDSTDTDTTDTGSTITNGNKTNVTTTTHTATTTKKKAKKSYTKSQLRLLACLIYTEAGSEPYAGKLAVGIVVKNRVRSSRYPDTLSGVIYQKSQFGVVRNGTLAKALKNYDKGKFTSSDEKACIKAAKAALSGTTKVTYKSKTINMKGYYSFSGYVKNARLKIGHHQFK